MINFPQCFPLAQEGPHAGLPLTRYSVPGNCRPSETFQRLGPEIYGIVTGARNGIWVLDLDRKNGKDGLRAMTELAADHGGLPDTYTVKTKSGGFHLYWRWPDAPDSGPAPQIRNRAGLLPGVDVRGEGGYVRAGGPYKVVQDCPIAYAPDWLVEWATAGQGAEIGPSPAYAIDETHPDWEKRLGLARQFLATEPPCISGKGGQAQLWKIALRLTRTYELPVHVCEELCQDYNRHCEPPWSQGELLRTFTRAANEGTGPTGMLDENWLGVESREAKKVPHTGQGGLPQNLEVVPVDGPWRQRPNPAHQYAVDMVELVAEPEMKQQACSDKYVASLLSGPAASPFWRGVWQYDEFRRRVRAVNPPFRLDAEGPGVTEADLIKMVIWCGSTGMRTNVDQIHRAITVAASLATYHPVRDYLDSLPKPELGAARAYFDGIASRLWGAEPERNALESGALRRWAIAAVRRVCKPGTKVDTMLVLAGEQGYNKSRFCAHLFGEHFRDQMPDLAGRDACQALDGCWGVEMAEMVAFSRSQEAIKKEFLSRCEDKYRPVWAKETLVVPRQCVFIGTTNEDDFLTDPTGARRYDICDIQRPIDLDHFSRDEFWAAACALELAGEPHWRTVQQEDPYWGANAPGTEQEKAKRYAAVDPWTDVVLKYAQSRAKEGWVTSSQALTYGVPIPLDRQTHVELKRVQGILRAHLGPSKVRWVEGRALRCYNVFTPVPT